MNLAAQLDVHILKELEIILPTECSCSNRFYFTNRMQRERPVASYRFLIKRYMYNFVSFTVLLN